MVDRIDKCVFLPGSHYTSGLELEVEGILGVALPDGAEISVEDDGSLHAAVARYDGSFMEVEITSNGEMYRISGRCPLINLTRILQSETLNPAKVAEAKRVILEAKKEVAK